MDTIEQAKTLFLRALEHHNRQRLSEAEMLYRQALALVPGRMSVLNNLAAVLIGQSRFAEALAVCERATAIEPGHPDSLANAATCRRELESPEHALRLLDAAIAGHPGDVEAHANRAGCLQRLGRLEPALESYDHALVLEPGHVGLLVNRGGVLARLGRLDEALACFVGALRLDRKFHQAGEGFIWLLLAHGYLPAARDDEFEALVIRAIREPWARPIAVAPVLLALLRADPVIAASVARVTRSWPMRLPLAGLLSPVEFDAVAENRLLVALLENAVVADVDFERWLGLLRAGLLQRALGAGDSAAMDPGPLVLHCALARQCYINEFVYLADPPEQAQAEGLRAKVIEAMAIGAPVTAVALVAVAGYFPLSGLPRPERLLERRWPAAVDALLEQQVCEPLQEQRLQRGIAALTTVADPVSRQVRQQYEENPYPRWVSTPRAHRRESLEDYLRRRVPTGKWRRIDDPDVVEALNAGCGTGQNPIETAQRLARVRVLAIDLSRASLGYAARMAAGLGLDNIEFAQGDILELGTLPRRFHLIESTGVLHHLHDPAQGLRILGSLLDDDGVMKLALYSEAARHAVVAARAVIAARGFQASAPDIRSCREALMRLDADSPERMVTGFSDFHSLSECRDLLFHVQEHQFTIAGIRVLLAEAGLDFIGFERSDTDAAGAGLPPANTLDGWHEHEIRHPDTFAGMYQFWVQKSARA